MKWINIQVKFGNWIHRYIFLANCYFELLLKISLYFFAVPLLINTLESKYNIGSVSHVTHSHQYKRHIGGWERLMTWKFPYFFPFMINEMTEKVLTKWERDALALYLKFNIYYPKTLIL